MGLYLSHRMATSPPPPPLFCVCCFLHWYSCERNVRSRVDPPSPPPCSGTVGVSWGCGQATPRGGQKGKMPPTTCSPFAVGQWGCSKKKKGQTVPPPPPPMLWGWQQATADRRPPPPPPAPLLQWDSGGVLGMRAGQPRLGTVGVLLGGKGGDPPPPLALGRGCWGWRQATLVRGRQKGHSPPPPHTHTTSPLQWDSRGCCGDGSKASPG